MNQRNLEDIPIDQYEMSSPFLEDGINKSNRQPLLMINEKSDSFQSSNYKIDTPGFKGTFNSGSVDYGYALLNYFDEGEEIAGNRNGQIVKNSNSTNSLYIFYQKLPVFLPNSVVMLIWKAIIAGIILLYFFVVPITVCYGSDIFLPSTKYIIDSLSFLFLLLDIALEFLTAFYEHGNLITDKERIAYQYLRLNFALDILGTLAFGIQSFIPNDSVNLILLLFFLKYPALIKIDYLFEEATLLYRTLRTIYNVGKIIVLLQFCFLIFSCIFYVIGKSSVEAGYNSWLLNDGNFGVIGELNPGFQFFFSYYFGLGTMTTTMGYGDITPLNVFECTWCLGGIFFAVFIFQVNVNSLFKIMEEFNVHPMKIFKKRIAVNKFMQSKSVPLVVQERVRRYLNEHWYEEGTRDLTLEQEIFTELAPEIKEELFYNSYGKMFDQIPFLSKTFSIEFLRSISIKIEEISFAQNEIIFLDNVDYLLDDFSIYFIDYGSILIFANTGEQRPFWIKQLESQEYFGEWSFLTGRPRLASASSISYSRLYKLKREVFMDILGSFQDDFEKYWMIRDKLIYSNDFKVINNICWNCESDSHYATQCPVTHYIPQITKELTISLYAEQERSQYQRKQKLRWNTILRSSSQIQKTESFREQNQNQENQAQQANNAVQVIQDQQSQKQKQIFDKPYQFKHYFPKFNYHKIQAFQNQAAISKINNLRKSAMYIPSTAYRQTKQSAIFVWPKQS
ncbi:unnamed protein product (macronuclear) [Paramecium tetraurelia]|uniref:Cyclic nucleotide-binding domain-containing protein n=1 Tax=Paramecium tetraurelia TaxID=5888 RepID=A0D965_PARTE|nr:uncharacterized protein GSPATT00014528001 [Paramecium tetraurelia]CAK79582.1 unnamed protein product [Paramecium tetraurelia]|eukprot:XP_001446979.1 hypothetical protein (macronuclear) [Paramecium tetraurelia strain d4-2]